MDYCRVWYIRITDVRLIKRNFVRHFAQRPSNILNLTIDKLISEQQNTESKSKFSFCNNIVLYFIRSGINRDLTKMKIVWRATIRVIRTDGRFIPALR